MFLISQLIAATSTSPKPKKKPTNNNCSEYAARKRQEAYDRYESVMIGNHLTAQQISFELGNIERNRNVATYLKRLEKRGVVRKVNDKRPFKWEWVVD